MVLPLLCCSQEMYACFVKYPNFVFLLYCIVFMLQNQEMAILVQIKCIQSTK